MKNKFISLVLASCMVLFGSQVFANSEAESYFGVQYASGTFSPEGADDIEPGALIIRFGEQISEYFLLEGRAGFGIDDDGIVISGIETVVELDTMAGIYGVGRIDMSNVASLYVLFGLTRGEFTVSNTGQGVSLTDDESGASYGLGINVNVNDSIAVNLEYMSYLSKTDFDYGALGLGVSLKF
ncbi:MAG: porin family protein [Gammaproteobacteria bacterium]|nr:porin family protein [Gammaproteobacteria bacterium]MCW8923572.1 porin family protein [Gammaproteobacteria bacterium]